MENPGNKSEVNHKNGIKTDTRAQNLEWVTRSENISHCYGLNLRSSEGESNGHSKLTANDVTEIRRLYASGTKQKEIASLYGIQQATVSGIILYKNWKHVA